MHHVTFEDLALNARYSREYLADLWGYKGFQALCRGVVTPARHPYIILFVTREKQASARQYEDHLDGEHLYWEGPADHFAEGRIVDAAAQGDEIHLFYRDRHHSDFTYMGRIHLEEVTKSTDKFSKFVFRRTHM